MTDKSFGDHINRNVVKNPLLSSAVTGLSIEDLTYNAVLLPVASSQELIKEQDENSGSRSATLTNTDHKKDNVPSGDANQNTILTDHRPSSDSNNFDNKKFKNILTDLKQNQSNASAKSDDDFDVNEYFARLQGTRYVSAPLNSILNEKQSMEASDESLEEINLNEPDKSQQVETQSLTADIAQNFSQLPSVLPHVASAVFSSFSNMLSMKSREQTPDEVVPKSSGYQEVKFQRPEVGVPLTVEALSAPKELAPPPAQLSVGGTTNFRITTKKKAYAQIPGLSSTQPTVFNPQMVAANNPPFNAPNTPYQAVPQQSQTVEDKLDFKITPAPIQTQIQETVIFDPITPAIDAQYNLETRHDEFLTSNLVPDRGDLSAPHGNQQKITTGQTVNAFKPNEIQEKIASATPIIPPPPMFSNLPRKDSQSNIKSVLPPSVARRIGTNHPIIKQQTVITPVQSENIFTPSLEHYITNKAKDSGSSLQKDTATVLQASIKSDETLPISSQSAFVQFDTTSITPKESIAPPSTPYIPSDLAREPYSSSSIETVTSNTQIQSVSSASPPSHLYGTAKISEPSNIQPPMFFNPVNVATSLPPATSEQTGINTSENLPTFQTQYFNPSQQTTSQEPSSNSNLLTNQPLAPTQEMSKSLPVPPKLSGNLNYRMAKRKPQYYSGPIEGVGAISNNVKPAMPVFEPTSFPGAVFTPEVNQQQSIEPPVAPFLATNQQTDLISSEVSPFYDQDVTHAPQQSVAAQDYYTTFDLSRDVTDKFQPPREETKGFGIIGSLKSKLGSLDINKIQNSVTTFFDPAFNNTKKDSTQEPANYNQSNYTYGFNENQDNNLQIYMPGPDQNPQGYTQTYGQYDPHAVYNFEHNNQYYQNQLYGSQIQCSDMQNVYSTYDNNPLPQNDNLNIQVSYFTFNEPSQYTQTPSNPYAQTHIPDSQADTSSSLIQNQANPQIDTNKQDSIAACGVPITSPIDNKADAVIRNQNPYTCTGEKITDLSLGELNISSAASFFDEQSFDPTQSLEIHKINQKLERLSIDDSTAEKSSSLTDIPHKEINELTKNEMIAEILNAQDSLSTTNIHELESTDETSDSCNNNPAACNYIHLEKLHNSMISCKCVDAVLGISKNLHECKENEDTISNNNIEHKHICPTTILVEQINQLENEIKNVSLLVSSSELDLESDESKNIDMIEDLLEDNNPLSDESQSSAELNICETCREVNKSEEREVDLTAQLIENITSPIQLSNPVVAPLTEGSTSVDDESNFSSKQCAEISHVTEETIETIQVQTATELLDDVDVEQMNNPDVSNYGWCAEDTSFLQPENVIDHNYAFEIDTNALGFYSNNSMFFENIPNNASDEIKAEFKNTQEDSPGLPPLSMNIPSVPPVDEDDRKSDETGGLDVQSIEQDANNDFPVYDEFVIEPSETDDDKIEYIERERNSEDPIQHIDTFTNRVDRFKLMEELVDKKDDKNNVQKNALFGLATTSTGISFASYFDTGNYAVETHYRNSLSSPTLPFESGSPSMPFRIPPGFEEEYKRKLGMLSLQKTLNQDNDINENIRFIPDTSTQTRPTTVTTYSTIPHMNKDIMVQSNIKTESTAPQELPEPVISQLFKKPPVITGRMCLESGASLTSSLFENPTHNLKPVVEPETSKMSTQSLPDPSNFFSTKEQNPPEISDNSFSRLASYFASPVKTDHGKSFFELSQSQNHYRHADTTSKIDSGDDSFKNTHACQNSNSYQLQNIPTDIYFANLKLMTDLTSSQNISFAPNDKVKTVNYFTVEYDKTVEIKNSAFNDVSKQVDEVIQNSRLLELDKNVTDDDANVETIVSECKLCCINNNEDKYNNGAHRKFGNQFVTLNRVELNTDFKVKKAMDSSNSDKRSDVSPDADIEQQGSNRSKEAIVSLESDIREDGNGATTMAENRVTAEYAPVRHHWFYSVEVEGKLIWRGFSFTDNKALEEAYLSANLTQDTLVATDGGRFDVNVIGRTRQPVYWTDKTTDVRRCSWFYKGTTDARYVPYTESVAEKLEEEYRIGVTTGVWHRRLELSGGELVVLHGPSVMVHLARPPDTLASQPFFTFGKRVYRNPPKITVMLDQPQVIDHLLLLVHGAGEYKKQKKRKCFQSTIRPRVVRRGCDEGEIEDSERTSIDHLLLLCHGVGSACDMRFRAVEEVVEDFRTTSLQLLQGHYRSSYDKGVVNRIEVLPISWHATLHSGETGVDKRLAEITLDSIPRLRNFTNDTVLDVLFYTSPVFCQTIIDTVCAELNRIYGLFASRNPQFAGRVSLGGHSLGSVILYDLLCHQSPQNASSPIKSYVEGGAGTGQAAVRYPPLAFQPDALYALGSPIAMFECIRGVKFLGQDFCLPTCQKFFNIFHPYDPIAYRIEPLINNQLGKLKPYLIPHHKGRKRMHLELKDTMARVGADLKQKLIESLRSTWTSMWKTQPTPNDGQLEKVVEEEMEKEQLCVESKEDATQNNDLATLEMLGKLNSGRRVDYVLQEAPFEMINEYLFAMRSHVGYWESEDTMLMILKEIYDSLGVMPDCSLPQQTLTVHRTRIANESNADESSDFPSTSRDGP